MRLFVPTNWDDALIERLAPHAGLVTLYGKAADDFVGGGRPRFVLPDPDAGRIGRHIARARALGMRFSYLLNAACLGNMEMTREGRAGIVDAVDRVVALGVDEITVSVRYLLDLIKRRHPGMRVGVGFFARVDDARKARQWANAGADKLALHPDLNRDFRALAAVRAAVPCELQVFATLTCRYGCHNLLSCGNTIAHSTNAGESGDGQMLDHPLYDCQLEQLEHPEAILAARWIRPEDVGRYRELGMDELKITERFNKTETLVRKVDAYTAERYDGNLLDLFASFLFNKELSMEPENRLAMIRRLKRAAFKPSLLPNYGNAPRIHLDGAALEGFLDGFRDRDCAALDCEACGWCAEFARRALTMDEPARERMVAEYRRFFDEFLSGGIFRDETAPGA